MIRSCLARIGCLTLVVLLAAGAWLERDTLLGWWRAHVADASVVNGAPTAELGRRSSRKLDDFLRGRGADHVSFDATELQSLVDYRYRDSLPSGVSNARIALDDSTLEASAALRVEDLMHGKAPDALRGLLGDSARATAELQPEVQAPGVLLLKVRSVSAGGLPIPNLMIPWLLQQTGLSNGNGPARAVALAVPRDVTGVRVTDGKLLLERGRPR